MSRPSLSFEVFPPATLPASFALWDSLNQLKAFKPDYISVTYGAQGGAQDRTRDAALAVQAQTGLPVAAHLTAARASRADVLARADSFVAAGVTEIVALRGDPDTPGAAFEAHAKGFANSVELVAALAARGDLTIRVGAYPESHPDAASSQQNIEWLKRKFDAGADEAITQFFFEAETFLRFRDECAKAGITQPIHPGILPITNWTKVRSFAQRCGAGIPAWLDSAFETAARDGREDLLALTTASEMCTRLIEEGVPHMHLYTLNTKRLPVQLLTALGYEAEPVALRNVA